MGVLTWESAFASSRREFGLERPSGDAGNPRVDLAAREPPGSAQLEAWNLARPDKAVECGSVTM